MNFIFCKGGWDVEVVGEGAKGGDPISQGPEPIFPEDEGPAVGGVLGRGDFEVIAVEEVVAAEGDDGAGHGRGGGWGDGRGDAWRP